jgi:hypothetical protein
MHTTTISDQFGIKDSVADSFRAFVDICERQRSIYAACMRASLNSREVLEIAQACNPGQPAGFLFASAVHYLLISNPAAKLAAYFPSVTDQARPVDAAFESTYQQFCIEHANELRTLVRTATVQFTNAERAATVLLALQQIRQLANEPFDLIEIGCSAGLLLNFDQYAYDLGHGRFIGDNAARLTIRSELRPTTFQPESCIPRIASRVGIDLNPIDVRNESTRNWVLASIFPDRPQEVAQLRDALLLRAEIPVDILQGDALELLPAQAARMTNTLCILHSWCLYQWPESAVQKLENTIRDISRTRPIYRIGIEKAMHKDAAEIVVMVYRDGQLESSRLVGTSEGRGSWVEWAAV